MYLQSWTLRGSLLRERSKGTVVSTEEQKIKVTGVVYV